MSLQSTGDMTSGPGLQTIVSLPPREVLNPGRQALQQSTMMRIFGAPGELTPRCSDVTNARLLAAIVTESVGPFGVTGHRAAVASLRQVMDEARQHEPEAYAAVQTAGMLCCRAVRGTTDRFSNHAWGFAVDLYFGALDSFPSDTCRHGMMLLYAIFHRAGWYWGANFPRRDPMHFEPSNELVLKWESVGKL